MFKIIREIHFSYGHRILNHPGKCGHLHGHNGKVLVELSSRKLNRQEMVMDFYDVKSILGAWIDEELDHRVILWKKDPLVKILKNAGEPVVVIERNPTAEVLSQWIFCEAKRRKLPISKVTFWETPTSAAVYQEGN